MPLQAAFQTKYTAVNQIHCWCNTAGCTIITLGINLVYIFLISPKENVSPMSCVLVFHKGLLQMLGVIDVGITNG